MNTATQPEITTPAARRRPVAHRQSSRRRRTHQSDALMPLVGLVVICAALAGVMAITLAALSRVRDDPAHVTALTGAAFTVIGTLVGAYFGIKTSAQGASAALGAMQDHAILVHAFAAHASPESVPQVLQTARELGVNHLPPTAPK